MARTAAEHPLLIRRGPHRLAAVLHRSSPRCSRLVVFAHGFTGHKIESGRLFVTAARALAGRGMDALRFDFMGSGDSSGPFTALSPQTEIADLHAVLDWSRRRGYARIGVLGLSLGGAVAICTVAQRRAADVAALCTWSSVPSFAFWRREPDPVLLDPQNCHCVGRHFFHDRPAVDVPAAYTSLHCPRLQIQGDSDLPGFRAGFAEYFRIAPPPKRHVVIPGADHVFTQTRHRRRVIRLTVAFFARWLAR
jgi:alpha/beta superfamily hydrolase